MGIPNHIKNPYNENFHQTTKKEFYVIFHSSIVREHFCAESTESN